MSSANFKLQTGSWHFSPHTTKISSLVNIKIIFKIYYFSDYTITLLNKAIHKVFQIWLIVLWKIIIWVLKKFSCDWGKVTIFLQEKFHDLKKWIDHNHIKATWSLASHLFSWFSSSFWLYTIISTIQEISTFISNQI